MKLINKDCIEAMREMNDGCIDLTVTSPPYDNLRNYKDSLKWNEEIWQQVISELYRVTKEGGVVVWVVGDATVKGSETGTSFRQALFAMSVGFRLHDTMIYQKENYLPLNHNRYDPEFEFMFVFSKGKPRVFNPLQQPCKTAGESYNFKNRSSASSKEKSGALRSRDETKFTKETKFKGNIWSYATGKNKGSKDDIWIHPATFPDKLAEDHILSWSNEGDVVFDPFLGSGTTGKIAMLNNREFIGIEKVDEYYQLAKNRIEKAQSPLGELF